MHIHKQIRRHVHIHIYIYLYIRIRTYTYTLTYKYMLPARQAGSVTSANKLHPDGEGP